MNKFVVYACLGFLAFTILLNNQVFADEEERFQKEQELRAIGADIRKSVLSKDPGVILKYVSKGGITCIDSVIPYEKVSKDLKNNSSWLYSYLFSSKLFEQFYADLLYPMGLDRFFETGEGITLKVGFIKVGGKERYDWACIHFISKNLKLYPEFCFFLKNGKWILVNSPYSCA